MPFAAATSGKNGLRNVTRMYWENMHERQTPRKSARWPLTRRTTSSDLAAVGSLHGFTRRNCRETARNSCETHRLQPSNPPTIT
eukprot:7224483-Prymnesium_polylepis.2